MDSTGHRSRRHTSRHPIPRRRLEGGPRITDQVTFALVVAGERAAVPLARAFDRSNAVDPGFTRAVCSVFHEMGETATGAVDTLSTIASSSRVALENRLAAVQEVGCIGLSASPAIQPLRRLSAVDPERFAKAVDEAIIAIGSREAARLLASKLRANADVLILRDIAALRENGRDAGPAVVEALSSSEQAIRVAAARALGFIGYEAAIDPLTTLLGDENDWQMVYVAAESLGRLRAGTAVYALEKVAATYWYPPVRDGARKAATVILGSGAYPAPRKRSAHHFAFEFFGFQYFPAVGRRISPPLFAGAEALKPNQLKRLTYNVEIVSYGTEGEHRTSQRQRPQVGLKVPDGFLVGSDRGEWEGELVYTDDKARATRLLDKNTIGIHRLPFGIVAVTGVAHLSMNEGALYLVKPLRRGHYEVSRWKTLPGAPSRSGFLPDGSLFVSCVGGDIVLRADGRLEMSDARLP